MRRRWRWFICGLYFRHPVCCTLRFSLGWPHRRNVAKYTPTAGVYVPCGIFHRGVDPDTIEDPAVDLYALQEWAELTIAQRRRGTAEGRDWAEHGLADACVEFLSDEVLGI